MGLRQHILLSSAGTLCLLLLLSGTTSSEGTNPATKSADGEQFGTGRASIRSSTDRSQEIYTKGLGFVDPVANCKVNLSEFPCPEQKIHSQVSPSFGHEERNQSLGSNIFVHIKKTRSQGSNSSGIDTNSQTQSSSSHPETDKNTTEIVSITRPENNKGIETRVVAPSPKNSSQLITSPPGTSDPQPGQISSTVSNLGDRPNAAATSTSAAGGERGRLLVAVARTLVVTTASTSVSTVLPTCYATSAATPACVRKRHWARKRMMRRIAGEYDDGLDSSQLEVSKFSRDRSPRLILWSSSTTTVFFTSTTTTGVTVSASVSCSFIGLANFPDCAG